MYRAYDTLDDAIKAQLDGLKAVHRYRPRSSRADEGTRVVMDATQLAETPTWNIPSRAPTRRRGEGAVCIPA